MDITSILTANLSDPSLTEMPVVEKGTYQISIDKVRLTKENNKDNVPVQVLRFQFRVLSPARKHNSSEIWSADQPISQQIQLTATGKVSNDMVIQNLASFVQACGESTLLTQEEAMQFNQLGTPGELPLPRFANKTFTSQVTVKPDQDGNPRNNIRPVLRKAPAAA